MSDHLKDDKLMYPFLYNIKIVRTLLIVFIYLFLLQL